MVSSSHNGGYSKEKRGPDYIDRSGIRETSETTLAVVNHKNPKDGDCYSKQLGIPEPFTQQGETHDGDKYRTYQQQVPKLFPWRGRRDR